MARPSRPPGFDMTYRPDSTVSFGPPLKERLPWLAYLAVALLISGAIVYGQHAPTNSWLFKYVVEDDRHRIMPASVCAIILFCSAIAGVLRDQMRGVVVNPEGIVLRELLSFGVPRVRRWSWSQIDKVRIPKTEQKGQELPVLRGNIGLDLWDGTSTLLPPVNNMLELAMMLERVALARAIPLEGTTGMLDDLQAAGVDSKRAPAA
ncbi:hypothetical protein [Polyangium sp. y55x31]|uniref:hypothetical protein n=1 Tax=Polyangium sp. y55x31 TaxID=3042688 RepID=UPI0024829085|nr:hypothetical protein [Polyangium sp. y55x31]MDI1482633.1 hypothetical protein [Polyangium sp. y55x31]